MPQDYAMASPVGHLRLHFGEAAQGKTVRNLSAIEQIGRSLWLATDEAASIDRLSTDDFAGYDRHQSFALADFFNMPGGRDQEADLEGLGVDRENGRLWLAGSHSLRRGQPSDLVDGTKEAAKALRQIDRQANRFLLGYLELKPSPIADPSAIPVPTGGSAMAFGGEQSRLGQMLGEDRLLMPFLAIPSKDNGLDIEGLAVNGDVVFVGLRGPVLRGWAIILQLELHPGSPGVLEPQPLTSKRSYLRHLLDLGGLGIRDLCVLGDDLLILAGPTMALDGPIRLYRWRDALKATSDQCVDHGGLQVLFDIPWGFRSDHAEGIALFNAPGQETRLVVVYDSPAKSRLHEGQYFEADLFNI